ncbi:MAG: ABC transporter substrate-binding protein [Elusimicrobia bacterium]|nr:ABC transporter substrate-binding protein [Elusimicrobiota bacterium]
MAQSAGLPLWARVLRVCEDVVDDAITLDPRKEFSEKNHTIIQQMFEGLVRLDTDGKIEPALATSWRWVDERSLEFTLREGVRFHNGEIFDAQAVKFSIEQFVDPKVGYPGAGFLGSVEKVVVLDARHVVLKTKFVDGILPHRLAALITIMPPRYIAEHGDQYFAGHPVGTGPFKFVQWEKNKEIVLAANTDYWLKGYPKFTGLVFKFIPGDEQINQLLKGEIDLVTEVPGTATLEVMKSPIVRIVKKEGFYTVASSLNSKTGPLSDRRVRQALNYAVDKKDLIRYDLLGNGKSLATMTMPGEIGHNPGLKPYPYNPKKARRLLTDAGYPDGFRVKALVKVNAMRTMQIIAKQLARVNIHVDIHPTTDAVAVSDMQKESWDWVYAGCPDPMSHSFFIHFIFLSSLSPFSVNKDAKYDELLTKMVGALDENEQHKIGMELDQYVHEQALSLFTYQRIKIYGIRRDIHFIPPVTGVPYYVFSHPRETREE